MSHPKRLILMVPVLIFLLACQTLLKPINDVKDVAGTAQSIATRANEMSTQMAPISTAFAATQEPDGSGAQTPDVSIPGNLFDPQGQPLTSWKDIPIMPQAVAGEEIESVYSFKVNATAAEVHDYYAAQLPALGWTGLYVGQGMPVEVYTKDSQTLTITITGQEGSTIVLLALG
ncbi:MAG TPA: hypothetical protein VIV15_06125 [Anaerolineales bacterium]